ncbi:hypothetical protein D9M69_539560 [compost metagenome]
MVHLVAARGCAPLRIVLQQLDIQTIQPSRGLDVEAAFPDLLDRRYPCKGQEEAEEFGKLLKFADDHLTRVQVFGLEVYTISRQDELCFGPGRSGASL